MTESFHGARVAHFESRMGGEMGRLIERHGGASWYAPALTEEPLPVGPAEHAVIASLARGAFDVVVLLTGAGTLRLFAQADRSGFAAEVGASLSNAVTIARGPKPAVALRQHGLRATHVVPEPNTTTELLDTLAPLRLAGAQVLILSSGDTPDEPQRFLRERGAHPVELRLYRWTLTVAGQARLSRTIDALTDGRIDVALFTAQVQVRHLFVVAGRDRRRDELTHALRARVLTGAVGPTCAQSLREHGVEPHVVPAHPRMGHLVVAAADAFAQRKESASRLEVVA